MSPIYCSALLCSAGELLDLVRGGQLAGAVDDCLAAAAAELDPLKQAALVKACAYGRAFQALEPGPGGDGGGGGGGGNGNTAVGGPTVFCGIACDRRRRTREVARRLRVLNALREPGEGRTPAAPPPSRPWCGNTLDRGAQAELMLRTGCALRL